MIIMIERHQNHVLASLGLRSPRLLFYDWTGECVEGLARSAGAAYRVRVRSFL